MWGIEIEFACLTRHVAFYVVFCDCLSCSYADGLWEESYKYISIYLCHTKICLNRRRRSVNGSSPQCVLFAVTATLNSCEVATPSTRWTRGLDSYDGCVDPKGHVFVHYCLCSDYSVVYRLQTCVLYLLQTSAASRAQTCFY